MENVPRALALVAALDPLSYAVDGIRHALIGEVHYGIGLDLIVLTVMTAAFVALGGYLFSKIQL